MSNYLCMYINLHVIILSFCVWGLNKVCSIRTCTCTSRGGYMYYVPSLLRLSWCGLIIFLSLIHCSLFRRDVVLFRGDPFLVNQTYDYTDMYTYTVHVQCVYSVVTKLYVVQYYVTIPVLCSVLNCKPVFFNADRAQPIIELKYIYM